MKTISQVYGLIHPDFEAMYDHEPELGLHPSQIKLRESWEVLAATVKAETNAALFYVTVLEKAELKKGLENVQDLGNLV